MEELLVAIFQFLLEVIVQSLVSVPFSFSPHGDYPSGRAGFTVLAFFGGLVLGWMSLVPFRSTSIHSPGLRIAALIASPMLAGIISYVVAELRNGLGHRIEARHHFWYALTFTSGLSIVRFAYAHHPTA